MPTAHSLAAPAPGAARHLFRSQRFRPPDDRDRADERAWCTQVVGIICVIVATVASSLKPVFGAIAMAGNDKPKLEPSLVLFHEQCYCMVRPPSPGPSRQQPRAVLLHGAPPSPGPPRHQRRRPFRARRPP